MDSLTEPQNTSSQVDICIILMHSKRTGVGVKAKQTEVEQRTEIHSKDEKG